MEQRSSGLFVPDGYGETASDLGFWTPVGEPSWSAVFPAGDEPDPGVVAAIRVFAPHYVPLWLRKEYKAPTGARNVYGWHVIGMHTDDPGEAEWSGNVLKIQRPSDWPAMFLTGQIYVVRVLWDDWIPGTWQAKRKLPRQYVPLDARLIEWMKATHQRIQQARDVRREMERELQAMFEAEDLALQKVEDETEANLREDAYSLLQAGMKAERSFQNGPRFQETKA